MKSIPLGASAELRHVVRDDDSAARWGHGVAVLATPVLLGLVELAAMKVIEGELEEGEMTVGTAHESAALLAPTPVGCPLVMMARLVSASGETMQFEVEAFDEEEVVYRGVHRRAVVSASRFAERAARKARRLARAT
ncbi:thioesterase family protein [Polyangium spumosum]|uniref:Fluoroacetyl-CoA-specific thioesterase-like domain-containing protein n=1 Tax=Polyangium spumosum TaxID=889282 RepID=A0A6N7PZG9_9BACT|nr:hotdog domain-containing protein [Polyangium spumosum]MRG95434.1 hypothetical protein [Polyangium spumosum]